MGRLDLWAEALPTRAMCGRQTATECTESSATTVGMQTQQRLFASSLVTMAAEVFDHSEFGDVDSDSFSYDEISCTGNEAHVQDCTYDTHEDCYGGEAAGVRCS